MAAISASIYAQSPIELDDFNVHRLTYPATIHLPTAPKGIHRVPMMVTVDSAGHVVTAEPREISVGFLAPAREYYTQAVTLEMQQTFVPYLVDGKPVSFVFQEIIDVLPPERWLPEVPFPIHPDLEHASIGFGQMTQAGQNFDVTFFGDGRVKLSDTNAAPMKAITEVRLSKQVFNSIYDRFLEARFLSAHTSYSGCWATDGGYSEISLTVNGFTKNVSDACGAFDGMPDAIANLELDILRVLDANGLTPDKGLIGKWEKAEPKATKGTKDNALPKEGVVLCYECFRL